VARQHPGGLARAGDGRRTTTRRSDGTTRDGGIFDLLQRGPFLRLTVLRQGVVIGEVVGHGHTGFLAEKGRYNRTRRCDQCSPERFAAGN
jgi:hypothetical protein